MIEDALFYTLKNAGPLAALVSTRIYPQVLPDKPVYPALTYSLVSAPRETAMGADPGLVRSSWQLSAWGQVPSSVRDTAEQARKAIERVRGTIQGVVVQDCFITGQTDLPPELVDGRFVLHRATDVEIIYQE